MKKSDIRIINDETGDAGLVVAGSQEDGGLMLLQRLYVLLLSNLTDTYRSGSITGDVLALLDGGNIPSDDVFNSLLNMSCAAAVTTLDAEDRRNVSLFSAKAVDGSVEATLTLADGTTVKGKLQ